MITVCLTYVRSIAHNRYAIFVVVLLCLLSACSPLPESETTEPLQSTEQTSPVDIQSDSIVSDNLEDTMQNEEITTQDSTENDNGIIVYENGDILLPEVP